MKLGGTLTIELTRIAWISSSDPYRTARCFSIVAVKAYPEKAENEAHESCYMQQ